MQEHKQTPIPDGIYGGKLNAELWKIQFDESLEKGVVSLLLEILKTDLLAISEEMLKKRFPNAVQSLLDIDIQAITENKELLARCLEIQLFLDRSRIGKNLKKVSDLYWNIFLTTNNYSFLVRRIALIRLGKAIFKNELTGIFDQIKELVAEIPFPYWQFLVIAQMPTVFSPIDCRDLLQNDLMAKVNSLADVGDFNGARLCMQSLGMLGSMTVSECLVEQAILYEREGDKIISEKKPHTFYPTISQKFSEGVKLIKDQENCQEIKSRLMLKLQSAQLEDAKMMAAVASDTMPGIDIKRLQQSVANLNLTSFESAFSTLIAIPILPKDMINDTAAEQVENQSFVAALFSDHVKISAEGKPIGFSKGQAAKANQLRMQHRELMIIFIKMIKEVMDLYAIPIKEAVYEMLSDLIAPSFQKEDIIPLLKVFFKVLKITSLPHLIC